ncbi:MAG: ABC transporter permease [Streptosporangiales bacterium]
MAEAPVAVRSTGRTWTDTRLVIGGVALILLVLAASLAPVIAPFDPVQQHLADRLLGPSWGQHLLGTDNLGRDLLSRLLYGLRPSLASGLLSVGLATVSGVAIGALAGTLGSWIDAVLSRVLDLLIAWPAIFLAIGLVLLFGSGERQVVLAIGLAELPVFARLMRAIALQSVQSPHVEAARSMGASRWRIIRRHILPFAVAPLVVQFAISAPVAVVAQASLSYLGLGTQPPHPSLGGILNDAQQTLTQSASGVVFSVLTIAVLVLAMTLIADGLQNILDPHGRRAVL